MRPMPSICAIAWISTARSATPPSCIGAAIGVDVLAEQVHFAHALIGELRDLDDHVVERTADFLAAGVRHHAVATVFRAAFHDRDEGGRAFGARLGQAVELFDLGEADVDLRLAGGALRFDQLGQAVQGLRAEHQVDIRRALDDRLAFLRGHAAADADQHRLAACLCSFQRPSWLKTFSCAFSRIEQVLIRITSASDFVLGQLHAVRRLQHVGHLGRVVLVHLAAVGLDEKLAAHGARWRGLSVHG
jgi:hypothetical protein